MLRLAVGEGDDYAARMQYTLRKVPAAVDKAIRARARDEGKSMNEVAVRALVQALGLGKAVEAALAAQDHFDEELWG